MVLQGLYSASMKSQKPPSPGASRHPLPEGEGLFPSRREG